MSRCSLFLTAVILLPALALCSYPWPDNVTQHKGYIEVNKTHGVHLFYWFFESRSNPAADPLVLWLTGGPGCSSELALLFENGPFLINGTADPVFNPYGWNAVANLLYVDQPAGTGFSYVTSPFGYVTNEREIATELWDFIRQFYALYPKYSMLDLYVFGESYAGHYVPATGQVIVESNSVYAKNLKGIAIGNGWVDPYLQYAAYGKYMLMEGFIDQSTADRAADLYKVCEALIDLHLYEVAFPACQIIEAYVLESAERKKGRSINVYDIYQKCEVPPLCYDMDNITKFLNNKAVQKDLGVNRTWEACRMLEELLLIGDWVHSFQGAAAIVLSHGRRVVVYSGKDDFICNYLGGNAWVESTQWSGHDDFVKAPFKDWNVNGRLAGSVKSAAGLTFIEVEKAGHMVPYNQPLVALQILNNTIHDMPFTT